MTTTTTPAPATTGAGTILEYAMTAKYEVTCNNTNCWSRKWTDGATAWLFTSEEIADAGGFINCDYCGAPMKPSYKDLDVIAGDVAIKSKIGEALAHKPSEFFKDVFNRCGQVMREFVNNYNAAVDAYNERK